MKRQRCVCRRRRRHWRRAPATRCAAPQVPAADAIHRQRRHAARPRGRRARRPGAAPGRRQRHPGGVVDAVPARPRSTPWCARRSASSPTLARAQARLRQAQEDLSARSGAQALPTSMPSSRPIASTSIRKSLGGRQLPVDMPFNLYLASVGVSYTFDLFGGGTRRELEALQAEVDHQHYELEAARLMLAGNVVTAAIREASLREQIARERGDRRAAGAPAGDRRAAASSSAACGAGRRRRAAPASWRSARADAARAAARSSNRLRHRLAVYTGQPPGAAQLPEFRLAELQLPAELPLEPAVAAGAPAARHPRGRGAAAAGRRAASASPPRTSTRRSRCRPPPARSPSSNGGDLFASGSGFYLLGASLAQPIFRGGELQAKRRSAVAAYEQAGAAYQEAVLQGFQNVADVLRALEADAPKLKERADAATQARSYHDIAAAPLQRGRGEPLRAARSAAPAHRHAARAHAGRRRPLCRFGRAAAGARRRLVEAGAACECDGAVMRCPAVNAAIASTIASRSTVS